MGIREDIKRLLTNGTTLSRLIIINTAVFLLLTLAGIAGFLLNSPEISSKVLNIVSVPSDLKSLLYRPWSVITYMFTHKDIWHILFNMLWFYWFGTIFTGYLGQRKLVSVYVLGGIFGAVVYVASFNIFPAFSGVVTESVAIGASASVMAVVISTAVYAPDYAVHLFLLGRIRIRYVALGIFILTSILDFSTNSGGKLAHMGGALAGYLYTKSLRKGYEMGKWINTVIDAVATLFKPQKKMRVTYKRASDDLEYNRVKAEHQARINAILDKISKGGYDSLTKEEKDLLFTESQRKK